MVASSKAARIDLYLAGNPTVDVALKVDEKLSEIARPEFAIARFSESERPPATENSNVWIDCVGAGSGLMPLSKTAIAYDGSWDSSSKIEEAFVQARVWEAHVRNWSRRSTARAR